MAGVASIQSAIVRAFSRPFEVGTADCCVAVADALVLLGKQDIAVGWRGYTQDEADRLISLHGGFLALMRSVCEGAGFPEVDEPRPGDVGASEERPAAIFDGARWWSKGPRGMIPVRRPDVMWRP